MIIGVGHWRLATDGGLCRRGDGSYPPRETCAGTGPFCTNSYKFRDSKSKLPLCRLQCYKVILMILAANAAGGVITDMNAEKALEMNFDTCSARKTTYTCSVFNDLHPSTVSMTECLLLCIE